MRTKGAKLVFFIAMISVWQGFSQQTPQFTQYLYNAISINPAYAGSRERMVVNILNRNQWVGIDGAPNTQTLTAHTPLAGSNLGVGLSAINDRLGFESIVSAYADVSYTINLDPYERYRLSFGLKAGAVKYNLDEELLGDPRTDIIDFSLRPNFGAGIYWRSTNYYFGLSAPGS